MTVQPSPASWVAWQKHRNGVCDRLGRYAVLKDGPGAREVIADNLRTQACANLVAAAPDLLAALQGLLSHWRDGSGFDEDAEARIEADCDAAIAKATGGAE